MRLFITKIKKRYERALFKTRLLWRKNKFDLSFSIERGIPKIHINEHYEKYVRWTLRIFTAIGIIASVTAFKQWYFNLLFALLLLAVEQLLEKAIYVTTTLFVTAIPEYKSDDWKGMMWVYSEDYHEAGVYFSSREAAQRIFKVIKYWSKDGEDDINNLVQVSIILDQESDDYHVYFYSNAENDPTYIATKEKREAESPEKEHHVTVFQIILCKGFTYSTSTFPKFRNSYKEGDPYYLYAYVLENNVPVRLTGLGHLKKTSIKIKNQKDLTRGDKEYEHANFIIDRDEYKDEAPPPKSREFTFRRSEL